MIEPVLLGRGCWEWKEEERKGEKTKKKKKKKAITTSDQSRRSDEDNGGEGKRRSRSGSNCHPLCLSEQPPERRWELKAIEAGREQLTSSCLSVHDEHELPRSCQVCAN